MLKSYLCSFSCDTNIRAEYNNYNSILPASCSKAPLAHMALSDISILISQYLSPDLVLLTAKKQATSEGRDATALVLLIEFRGFSSVNEMSRPNEQQKHYPMSIYYPPQYKSGPILLVNLSFCARKKLSQTMFGMLQDAIDGKLMQTLASKKTLKAMKLTHEIRTFSLTC